MENNDIVIQQEHQFDEVVSLNSLTTQYLSKQFVQAMLAQISNEGKVVKV